MSEKSASSDSKAQVQAHLHAISKFLREADHLGPEAQALLADLFDELGNALESTAVPNAEVARLAECVSHLAQAVHEKHEPGILESASDRLERAVVTVESKAPALAALTRRLADMLSNLGI